MNLELRIGALAPTIAEQVEAQGLDINPEVASALQSDHEALNRLAVRGFLTDAQKRSVSRRIVRLAAKAARVRGAA